MKGRPLDTSAEADRVRFERFRQMSSVEKSRLVAEMSLAVQRLRLAGLKKQFPDESRDDLILRMAVERLGEEKVREVWGRVPGEPRE